MAPTPLQQRKTHNTLLLQKLLNLRDGASPFTLILDSLEQSGASLVGEFAVRAKFENIFISTRGKSLSTLRNEVLSHIPSPSSSDARSQKFLIIIDALHPLVTSHRDHYPTFLSSLLTSPSISLLATLHTDIPISNASLNPYFTDATSTLSYLATAILSVKNLEYVIARKRARDRSMQEPRFGLREGREGVLVGLHYSLSKEKSQAVVLDMELRRKSGRGIIETFVLSAPPSTTTTPSQILSTITLLDSYPPYSTIPIQHEAEEPPEEEGVQTTFSLGLTEKQKRDREDVVLPYFDAQKEGGALGAGEGGRILYEMGDEDREDFDDEEDEI
ncbi:hypothetical protein B7494_g999 [Chlorociboria aeruginascens]|nr:hypothetical protein B7494_g999 [Chlorociboria aeruginascens]